MHREETESPSKGNREPLLGSKEEKGTAQSFPKIKLVCVENESSGVRGWTGGQVMSQENKGCMSQGGPARPWWGAGQGGWGNGP